MPELATMPRSLPSATLLVEIDRRAFDQVPGQHAGRGAFALREQDAEVELRPTRVLMPALTAPARKPFGGVTWPPGIFVIVISSMLLARQAVIRGESENRSDDRQWQSGRFTAR